MKTLLTLLILSSCLTVTAQHDKLIGTWTGEDQGEVGSVIFDAEGYCAFVIAGELMGGKEFELDGEMGSMSYILEGEEEPIKVTMTMTKLASGDSVNMYGLIRFKDPDTIEFALGSPGRPVTAFTAENSIILKRESE